MSKTASILWVVAMIGLAAVVARPARAGGGQRGTRNVLLSIPGLNADQKSRITHLTNTAKLQTAPLREQIAAARKNLVRLWSAEPLDKQSMDSKRRELDGAMDKVRAIWADFVVQLHDVLTGPQREWLSVRAPGLLGNDAGPDLGVAPGRQCPCDDPPAAQHPGPLQEQ
jgi:Spy/CpxP family protein refolding chaperone